MCFEYLYFFVFVFIFFHFTFCFYFSNYSSFRFSFYLCVLSLFTFFHFFFCFIFIKTLFSLLCLSPLNGREKVCFFMASNEMFGKTARVVTLLLYALCRPQHNTIQLSHTHVPDVEKLQTVEAKRVRLIGHLCLFVLFI